MDTHIPDDEVLQIVATTAQSMLPIYEVQNLVACLREMGLTGDQLRKTCSEYVLANSDLGFEED